MLLPPSETKSSAGAGAVLDLGALSFPELTATRRRLVDALVALSADSAASQAALGLSRTQAAEVGHNAALRTAATTSALRRYTGVLYDALDAGSLTSRSRARLVVASALFGLVRADDPIPTYRLSGGSRLPGLPSLRTLWRPVVGEVLTGVDELVVDLRSGVYAALGPAPGAVTATVLTAGADGRRTVVSHHNKTHKGLLARALARTRAEPTDARGVARVAAHAGLRVELASATELVVLT